MVETLLMLFNVVVALVLVIVILLQRSDGGLGGAFGGGSSAVAGGNSAQRGIQKTTSILATLFMVSALALVYLSTGQGKSTSVLEEQTPKAQQSAPAVPVVPAPVEGSGTQSE